MGLINHILEAIVLVTFINLFSLRTLLTQMGLWFAIFNLGGEFNEIKGGKIVE